ncbi:hypothetical protein F5B17DRAFT_56170 [Nemania serpens]|nr:hypothetical protein F5B17DRAFT_56170 [Nemania serpens]
MTTWSCPHHTSSQSTPPLLPLPLSLCLSVSLSLRTVLPHSDTLAMLDNIMQVAMATNRLLGRLAESHELAVRVQHVRLAVVVAVRQLQLVAAGDAEAGAARALRQRAQHLRRRARVLALDPDHPVVRLVVVLYLLAVRDLDHVGGVAGRERECGPTGLALRRRRRRCQDRWDGGAQECDGGSAHVDVGSSLVSRETRREEKG